MTDVYKDKLNTLSEIITNFEKDYKNELEEYLNNPQNTCEHKTVNHKYKGHDSHHDYYDIVCADCGKIIDTYRS